MTTQKSSLFFRAALFMFACPSHARYATPAVTRPLARLGRITNLHKTSAQVAPHIKMANHQANAFRMNRKPEYGNFHHPAKRDTIVRAAAPTIMDGKLAASSSFTSPLESFRLSSSRTRLRAREVGLYDMDHEFERRDGKYRMDLKANVPDVRVFVDDENQAVIVKGLADEQRFLLPKDAEVDTMTARLNEEGNLAIQMDIKKIVEMEPEKPVVPENELDPEVVEKMAEVFDTAGDVVKSFAELIDTFGKGLAEVASELEKEAKNIEAKDSSMNSSRKYRESN